MITIAAIIEFEFTECLLETICTYREFNGLMFIKKYQSLNPITSE